MDQIQKNFLESVATKSDGGSLRGDYEGITADYVVDQNWSAYTEAEHALWRRLYERQMALLPNRACEEFIVNLKKLSVADGIPDFKATSALLEKATGWTIVAVPGLIPEQAFFEHLAHARFPVTTWLRKPEEFDYIVEPDVFHDYFGHVPLLFDPIFAKHMQEYGKGGLRAMKLGALDQLARLYWYTIEFGLVQTKAGLRAYGAGILSSVGEIVYCLEPSTSRHIAFNVERCLRTLYKIDTYQQTYFVINSFQQLFDDTAVDFAPIYERVKQEPPFPANTLLPEEVELIGTSPST